MIVSFIYFILLILFFYFFIFYFYFNLVFDIQLLQMIDDGQAVDIKGISERSLIKHLKKLFLSLRLKESGDRLFLLPPNARPTLEIVGPLIHAHVEPKEQQLDHSVSANGVHSVVEDAECGEVMPENNVAGPNLEDDTIAPRRRYKNTFVLFFT